MPHPRNWVLRHGILAACFLALGAVGRAADSTPPNIVLVLIDDQGYYDLGCYGAKEISTPRIDAIAQGGVRFTDYYAAAPICSPSRAGLLTGCYPRRVGLETWVQRADSGRGIHPSETTLPELLQQHGYDTACIGKWHLGAKPPFLPRKQGFNYYFGLLHNLDPVETVFFDKEGGSPVSRNEEVVARAPDPGTLTKLYTDEAIAYMERSRNHPFFLYLAHTMVHPPLGVSPEFAGKSGLGMYGDAVQELDYNMGRLMDALTRLGIADKTIVIYLSDNGRGPGRTPGQPLRGNKLTTLEAGIRVPGIIWGPGEGIKTDPNCSTLVHAMDWYPTIATLAGIKIPEGHITDGRDLVPLLRGKVTEKDGLLSGSLNSKAIYAREWRPPLEWQGIVSHEDYLNAFFYHGSEGQLAAVRSGKWKLNLLPQHELFDLEADPAERTPVRNQEVSRMLTGMALLFQDEMRRDRRPLGELMNSGSGHDH